MSKRPCSPSSYYPPRHSRPYTSGIHTFPVYPPRSYTGRPPNYRQPVEINSYSIDHQRQVWFDNRELKYFYPPNGKDLFSGYDAFVQRDESLKEHLDTLLDALTDAQQKSEDPNLTRVDIVTWRGIMTKILCTPFTKNEPWILRATKHKNAIYIEEEQTEEKRIREDILPIRQQLLCYSGYRFETLCTLSKPPSQIEKEDPELKQRLNDSANTNIQYCVLVKTKIGNTSLIMGAEVDCCKDLKQTENNNNPLDNYIELKTSRIIETDRQKESFERHKLKKFWAQSFLIGVPLIICGFRDDRGMLKNVEEIKTQEIPRRVRNTPGSWDSNVCLIFADQFLNWLRTIMVEDDVMSTHLIEWKAPWHEITIRKEETPSLFMTQRYLEGTTSHTIGGPRVSKQKIPTE